MIHVSQAAKERIERIRSQGEDNEPSFLRVTVEAGGCSGLSYKIDFDHVIGDNDEVFEDNGERIVTDVRSVLYLFGSTLQFSEGLNGKGFYFDNPNASRTCSCGESFSL